MFSAGQPATKMALEELLQGHAQSTEPITIPLLQSQDFAELCSLEVYDDGSADVENG